MVFGIFVDKKIEKVAAVIDEEFKNILKLAVKYNHKIKLTDFKKEYKSKKLKDGEHPVVPDKKIVVWWVDVHEDVSPFKFYAEIEKNIVTSVHFDDHIEYLMLEGGISGEYAKWDSSKPQIGVGTSSDPLLSPNPDISNSMKLKKFIIKKYNYEDMKRINPKLWG